MRNRRILHFVRVVKSREDTKMTQKTWLITGSGNGLGRNIAEGALKAGDNVVAGARRTGELAPLVDQYGERVKPVTLEVRDEAAAKAAVRLAGDTFGRLDVLVNNAGYGQFAPFEQMSAEDFQAVVDTCFYGVVYTTRAAIPVMRKQKSGHIFQVSSVGGRMAIAGNTPYHAAKWWAASATLWRWRSRPSGSRSALWSQAVFGPTGRGAQGRTPRNCYQNTRLRSVQYSSCSEVSKEVRKAIQGRSQT
jgi:nucleoside-diphosphate-sugar epimerase